MTFFSLPTGGWRRRGFSGADRDLFPQQAHAEGFEEPAGRLCCPMSGIRAGTFSERGRGDESSQSRLGDERQHLRWHRRRPVRHKNTDKSTNVVNNNILCHPLLRAPDASCCIDLLVNISPKQKITLDIQMRCRWCYLFSNPNNCV